MSRVGRTPIELSDGAKVEIAGKVVTVSGAKGELTFELPAYVEVAVADGRMTLSCTAEERDAKAKALFGTCRARIQNMVTGVTKGFRRELEIQGVGYRGHCKQNTLVLALGYSHLVEFPGGDGVALSMPENTKIVIEGIDKQKVGQAAATIRGFRPPDAYKGKGIRYVGEEVTLKEGKTVS